MSVEPGIYGLGPENATLAVRTRRTGAAAKAGHDLTMHVTAWTATLTVGDAAGQTTVELDADSTSLRVQHGTGGMQALEDDDKANIHQTIDDEVLKREDITFRSTAVQDGAGGLTVTGELALLGTARPVTFELSTGDDGALQATTVLAQTDWGMKPYSALFGALKVADEVEVALEGHL